ncbi:MAG: hypothetical protein KDA66_15525 [Planctomycetaceae bacterium]|nr:hypothetical protein [Planctomycetaceae bacterium]
MALGRGTLNRSLGGNELEAIHRTSSGKRFGGSRARVNRPALARVAGCVIAVLLLTSGASAQNLFQKILNDIGLGNDNRPAGENARILNEPEAVMKDEVAEEVDPEFSNEFTPILTQVLNSELFFVYKVCRPSEAQLKSLRDAGKLEIARIAKEYGRLQANNRTGKWAEWPNARERICRVIASTLQDELPDEKFSNYQREVAARFDAQRTAARGMMLNLLDDRVFLTNNQADEIDQKIKEQWNDDWSRNLMVFSYPQYAPRPSPDSIKDALDEQQLKLISNERHFGNISFGWQTDLGLTGWQNMGVDINPALLDEWTETAEAEVETEEAVE